MVRAIATAIIVIILVVSSALVLNPSSLRAGTALGAAYTEVVEGVGRYFEVGTGESWVELCSGTRSLGKGLNLESSEGLPYEVSVELP